MIDRGTELDGTEGGKGNRRERHNRKNENKESAIKMQSMISGVVAASKRIFTCSAILT